MGLKDLAKASPKHALASSSMAMEVGSVGLSFAFAIAIGAGGGWWLDRQFGWQPWGVGIGLVLGLIAGVRNVVGVVKKYL